MDVFDLRNRLVDDYASYTRSFIKIADPRIKAKVDGALDDGVLWPEPLLQLNPAFLPGGTIDDLVADDTLHPECKKIFRIDKSDSDHAGKQLLLYAHQTDVIRKSKEGKPYVLTSGSQWDEKEMRDRLNAWVQVRHSIAHGFPLPNDVAWIRNAGGQPPLNLYLLRQCKKLFARLVVQTDAAFAAFLQDHHGVGAPW